MDIILASNNKGKIREFKDILEPFGFNVFSLKDINYNKEIIEDGTTFKENALIKAKTICKETGKITISDDSGLCVRALNYAPGVYSARFSPTHDDDDNNALLLEKLKGVSDRYAYYECSIIIYYPDDTYLHYQGICEGNIGEELVGNNGFGYDPLFYPLGFNESFGQISKEIKNEISHRAKALRMILNDIDKIKGE